MKTLLLLGFLCCFLPSEAQHYSRRPLLIVHNPLGDQRFALRIGDRFKLQVDSTHAPIKVRLLRVLNDSTIELSKLGKVPLATIYSIRFTPRKANRTVKQVLLIGSSGLWLYGYVYVLRQGPGETILNPGAAYVFITTLISPFVIGGIELAGLLAQTVTDEKVFYRHRNLSLSVLSK